VRYSNERAACVSFEFAHLLATVNSSVKPETADSRYSGYLTRPISTWVLCFALFVIFASDIVTIANLANRDIHVNMVLANQF
jgi:hypothetical protein